MKRLENYLLVIVLLLAFFLRLYKIETPLADWHSWRQADTSAVSRSFVLNGFDILHPRYHDLSNVPSGYDNPEGYRFVEFPVYNLLQAGIFKVIGVFTLEQWGRLVSIAAAVFSTLFIYLIVKKYADVLVALFAALFYAVLPFNIYFGRTILPDQSMVMAILGGIYFFDQWMENSIKYPRSAEATRGKKVLSIKNVTLYITALLFTAVAFLLKPYALFYTLPMVYIAWNKYKLKTFLKWQMWLFLIVSITPLIVWRLWIQQYPEGIPVNDWLFNAGNIRFKGAFFYWLFADRIGRLILGYWGIALLIIGILTATGKQQLHKSGIFFYTFLFSSLLYMTVIARGNVQHDYYQILIVPSIVIFLSFGARALAFPHKDYIHPFVSRSTLILIILFSLGFSWYHIRDYYNVNESIVIAGQAADDILPDDAKVIAPLEGDTTFLYHTKRRGWASFQNPLPEMITKGATHLILVNPTEKDMEFGKEYPIVSQAKEYIIFKLK